MNKSQICWQKWLKLLVWFQLLVCQGLILDPKKEGIEKFIYQVSLKSIMFWLDFVLESCENYSEWYRRKIHSCETWNYCGSIKEAIRSISYKLKHKHKQNFLFQKETNKQFQSNTRQIISWAINVRMQFWIQKGRVLNWVWNWSNLIRCGRFWTATGNWNQTDNWIHSSVYKWHIL